ncbi:hypothetical protein SUGI_0969030 [Cryptomeria japonica]|nr:hypothetical protein SUGI_0969030 [Cryptomeria japonica]
MLGNVNAYNGMLNSTFNSQLRDFSLSCWLEHGGVGFGLINGPLAKEIRLTDSVTATKWESVVEEFLHVTSHLRDPEWSQRVMTVEEAIEVLSVIRLLFLFHEAVLKREVRHCKDNGLIILATSHTSPTNFLPLFETVASVVSEVSIGVCDMTELESKFNNLKRNNGGVVERGDVLEESEVERDPNGMFSSLGPKISDWDQQQRERLKKNPRFPNFLPNGQTCNFLFTGLAPKACENPVGDHLLLKSIKNKIDYSRLHSIEIFYNMAHLDSEMSRFWAKFPLYRKLILSHPEVQFIWWMDSDTTFTDMAFESLHKRYKQSNPPYR